MLQSPGHLATERPLQIKNIMKSFLEYLKIIHNLYIKNKCFIKRDSYSQDGEDKVLREIFKILNLDVRLIISL